jgi:DNA-binding MarR family transcriptional regulator
VPRGHSIDDSAVHSFLFRRTDRLGRIRINQTELAGEFGITKFTMSRVINRMIDAKRIRRLSSHLNNRGVFIVEDPEVWEVMNAKAAKTTNTDAPPWRH